MWLSEYGKCPNEVDAMSINDVYMVLYARLVRSINDRFKEIRQQPQGDLNTISNLRARYGE